jgi:hypothetical protein
MKKQLIAVMFAVAMSLVINAGETFAQSQAFRVKVPFDFSANNKTLPAGTYVVHPATDNRVMWRVQGADQDLGTLLLGGISKADDSSNIRVRFTATATSIF